MKKFEELYLFIYIDALPLEYINPVTTPYLSKLMNAGSLHILKNIPGYSFGIQSTIFSGNLPQETLHWMPYIFKTDNTTSLVRNLKNVCEYNYLICYDIVKKSLHAFRRAKHKVFKLLYKGLLRAGAFYGTKGVKLYGLPPDQFEKIFVFPYYYMNDNPFFIAFKREIEDLGVMVHYLGHSLSKNIKRLPEVLNRAKDVSRLLMFAYIDDLDKIGHSEGLTSEKWFNTLKLIDFFIYSVYGSLLNMSRQIKVMVFSDHGMCDVDEYIDLESLLLNRLPRECIDYFIDASLAFIRIHKDSIRDLVSAFLRKKLGSKALIFDVREDAQILRSHGVFFPNGEYGDIIVQTKPCKELFPNFYSITHRFKGLHGFWPSEQLQQAFIIEFSAESSREDILVISHIKDLRTFIMRSLS